MLKRLVVLTVLIFSMVSCGDSPFLNSEESKSEVSGTARLVEKNNSLSLGTLSILPNYEGVPKLYENNDLVFLVFNESGKLLSPKEKIKLELWMPDHGHGSFPIRLEEVSKGIYKASDIFFTMPGLWDLRFQLLDDNENILEEVIWPIVM